MTWQTPDPQEHPTSPVTTSPQPDRAGHSSPTWATPPAPNQPGASRRWPSSAIVVTGALGGLVVLLGASVVVVGLAWLGATSRADSPSAGEAVPLGEEPPARFANGQPVGELGDTASWGGQLEATVTTVRQQPPSPFVVGLAPGHVFVVAEVRFTNTGAAPYKGSAAMVTGRYGPDEGEAKPAADAYMQTYLGDLPPGGSATREFGLSVPPEALGELLVQVKPDPAVAPASWKVSVNRAAGR